jgi:hypothetical protein
MRSFFSGIVRRLLVFGLPATVMQLASNRADLSGDDFVRKPAGGLAVHLFCAPER